MAGLPLLSEPSCPATLSAGPPPRSSTLPLPLPVKALAVQRRKQLSASSDHDVLVVNSRASKNAAGTHSGDDDENFAFDEEATDSTDTANPYNLLSADKPEEHFSVGETFTDTTLSFVLSGRINAEQVSHLTHLFRQTICCDLEACIRAGRSSAPGIYASSSCPSPCSSSTLPLGNLLVSDRLFVGGAKRCCRRVGNRRGSSVTSQRNSSSSLSCWKLKEGKCISFKREDAYARLLLKSATISTRGLVLSCRRPLIIADVNERQCVSRSF